MNLTPAQRRDIRRWTYRNQRARAAYEAEPIALGRAAADCDYPYCRNQRAYRGMCERHNRERDEKGAS